MKTSLLPILYLACCITTPQSLLSADESSRQGDRCPAVNCVFPEAAFLAKGGPLIDVTQPPFNAKGDGKTDDTKALIAALDYVMKSRDPSYVGRDFTKGSYALYLPNGTYLVSDTVAYSLPVLVGAPPYDNYTLHYVMSDEEVNKFPVGRWSNEHNSGIIIFGQSRNGTVIKLRDNCPGFSSTPKPVVAFCRLACGSNVNMNNVIENLTIDTGCGNAGAIGLRWNVSNTGDIRNLAIRSGDKTGIAGLACDVRNTQGLVQNITIDGFNDGLLATAGAASVITLEHATFTNQRQHAILVANTSRLAARNVATEGPAIGLQVESSSHAVLIDSILRSKDQPTAAIQVVDAHLFARNVASEGYSAAIDCNGRAVVKENKVDEFISEPGLAPNSVQPGRSMQLPIVDPPEILHESDLSRWANVDDYGARGDMVTDDTDAIQQAMNSGKSVIFFPKAGYIINGTVNIPKTVRQITFLYGCAVRTRVSDQAMFRIAEDSPEALLVHQNINVGGLFLDHAAQRTLVLEDAAAYFPFTWETPLGVEQSNRWFPWKPALPDSRANCWRLYRNATPQGEPKTVFVNNALGFAAGGPDAMFAVENVNAWCRQANTEHYHNINFAFRRSTVWMLGFKTEIDGTHFCALDGTRLEVLGGLYYQGGPEIEPIVIAKDSRISIVMTACDTGNPSNVILEDWRDGQERTVGRESCPLLHPQLPTMPLVPLLVNYPADAPGK